MVEANEDKKEWSLELRHFPMTNNLDDDHNYESVPIEYLQYLLE